MKIDGVSSEAALPSNKPIYYRQNSAILLLVKKMVSVVGGMIDLPWYDIHSPEGDNNAGNMDEMMSCQTKEHLGMAAGLLADVFLPYLSPMLKVILPSIDDYEDGFCYCHARSNVYHIESQDKSTSSTSTPEITQVKDDDSLKETGLILPIPEVIDRLDYVITQMDISRMKRTASRVRDVDSINRLPTVIYGSDLICPPYEDDAEYEDFEIHDRLSGKDNSQVWSWMVVPRNTSEEISRIPGSNWRGIPESISICSSNHSMGSPGQNGREPVSEFDFCVICKEHFREGECLRVLPCEHRFHCTCINFDKMPEDVISRCPMCKKNALSSTPPCSSSLHSSIEKKRGLAEKVETLSPSDGSGSVPSWAFVKLGSLLSSKGSKDNDSNHDG